MIKTPVVFEIGKTVIKYPINRSFWKNTFIEDGLLVGDYEGKLFLADGATKAFDWDPYTAPPQNYGTLMTGLAFFDRMLPQEESFFREGAKVNVDLERLLARSERLTENIDLARADVRDGVAGVLNLMHAHEIAGYNADYVELRKIAILDAPLQWDELPEKIQLQFGQQE